MDGSTILITGAKGQIGSALKQMYPNAKATDSDILDITDLSALEKFDWQNIKVIINAAAYTNVDGAEMPEGRISAWQVNAMAVSNLARVATVHDLTLVHISTEYVFDGTKNPHMEDEPLSPLGVYAQSKAGGDVAAMTLEKLYLIRASWVVGEGKNFVRTMLELGEKGINPTVIADDVGRPSFADEVARAIQYLLEKNAEFGIYNVSNEGDAVSWADLTREIFKEAGFENTVTDTTNVKYYADKPTAAPRPHNSVFDLSKIHATGFQSKDWREDLKTYVKKELR